MKKTIIFMAVLLLSSTLVMSREPKEYDNDVIYDESKIPHYDLPRLLVTAEGKKITTREEWRNIRRPHILSLFGNLVYGSVPEPESPIKTVFTIRKSDAKFMGGKATRKDVQIRFSNDKGAVEMLVLVFVPNKANKPVPACIAPRPVYVHSGVEDTWADGRGEYLSAYHASEVYHLLGKKGLSSELSPPVGEAIIESDVGYHNCKGGHSVEMYDWQRFLDFADYHLKKKK